VICIAVILLPCAKMPCHQLLTKNETNPALKAANSLNSKSFSWTLKRLKPEMREVIVMDAKSVFSVNVHKQVLTIFWEI